MAYADGLLSTGERIFHREKQHWWVFVWGAKWTIFAIIVAIVLFALGNGLAADGASGFVKTVTGWISAGLLIVGIAFLIWTTITYLSQEYVLTNRRVIQVSGVVNKRAVDSSLEKINDAVLTQSIFGRALDFGDLEILTASDAAISDFHMLKHPIAFKKAMLDAKHDYERDVAGGSYVDSPPMRAPAAGTASATATTTTTAGSASPPAPSAGDETVSAATPGAPVGGQRLDPDEVTRTLASLADLRDRGAITPEEYERKKTDLLSRL